MKEIIMLKILCPNSSRDKQHLSQMHQLRYKKFVEELEWEDGISAINQLEFDCFDHKHAFYMVHVDENDHVDAIARLIQTSRPNLLMDIFKENVQLVTPERANDVLEISRFCADSDRAPKDVMPQIMTGLLELGLACNIRYYVSFSDVRIKARTKKFGWNSEDMGFSVRIGREVAVALRHPIDIESYEKVKQTNAFKDNLLSPEELSRCPLKSNLIAI